MIQHVIDRLHSQVDALIVIGRDYPGEVSIADRPGPGLGPLGGLSAALAHALAHDFSAVLTSGCDLPDLPAGLAARLGDGPAAALGQPLLALWPAGLGPALDAHIAAGGRSLYGWVATAGARQIDLGPVRNINTVKDLDEK